MSRVVVGHTGFGRFGPIPRSRTSVALGIAAAVGSDDPSTEHEPTSNGNANETSPISSESSRRSDFGSPGAKTVVSIRRYCHCVVSNAKNTRRKLPIWISSPSASTAQSAR
jgi:hypothetical protein